MPASTHTWPEALDRLERDLVVLEAVTPGAALPTLEPWTASARLGSMPVELETRARALLARQQTVLERLTAALTGNRQQARVADSVHAATGTPDRPAYLDIQA